MKSLLFSHNHHLLSVKGCEAGLDVLAFEGDEALSQPFRYRIEFTSADHAISKEMMLMKAASLTLQAPVAQGFGINVQQPVRVIQGVVTGFERLSTSRDETHYALTLQPRLALLNRSHQNAIYQDQSVPQIVEKILRERHGLRGQDFLFSLTKTYPRREQVMQYGEDDLRFITRLLGEVGIWFRFTADTRLHIDVAEFCDSQQGYEKGLTLPSVPPSGQQSAGVDAVWEMACRHRVVEQQVSTRDYNYREATADMSAQVDVTRGETTTFGEAYHWGDNYLTAGNAHDRHPAPESGAFYARLRHERYLNGQTRMQAITSCPTLCPGQVLKVTGGEEVAGEFADGVLITAMHSHARRDADFAVEFAGIPDSPDVGYPLRPMRVQDGHTEIYTVDSVISSHQQIYAPFSSFRHKGGMMRHDAAEYYYHTRVRRGPSGLYNTWLIVGGEAFDNHSVPENESLSLTLTGTNGQLPRRALQSTVLDTVMKTTSASVAVRNLCAPTLPCYPPAQDRFHWRVLSHLGSSFLSLMDNAEVLRGTLALYEWTDSEMNRRRLEAILDVNHRATERFAQGHLVRGVQIEVTLDTHGFAGRGDICLFGEMLSRFFALYTDIYLFNRLIIILQPTGERLEWEEKHSRRIPG
ncbi:type VI secretion system tip protein VgrG [Klebsiella sp. GG_Kp176]